MRSNSQILTAVTAEFVRQFKAAGISPQRAALMLGITAPAASYYLSGKRGGGIPINKKTKHTIRRMVLNAQIPRAEIFRACLIEVMLGQIVIKTKKEKEGGHYGI